MPTGVCYDINTGDIISIHIADKIEDLLIQVQHNSDWAILEINFDHPVRNDTESYKVENDQIIER